MIHVAHVIDDGLNDEPPERWLAYHDPPQEAYWWDMHDRVRWNQVVTTVSGDHIAYQCMMFSNICPGQVATMLRMEHAPGQLPPAGWRARLGRSLWIAGAFAVTDYEACATVFRSERAAQTAIRRRQRRRPHPDARAERT
jgi:hypothetical protein